jgi:hypothetical protein
MSASPDNHASVAASPVAKLLVTDVDFLRLVVEDDQNTHRVSSL